MRHLAHPQHTSDVIPFFRRVQASEVGPSTHHAAGVSLDPRHVALRSDVNVAVSRGGEPLLLVNDLAIFPGLLDIRCRVTCIFITSREDTVFLVFIVVTFRKQVAEKVLLELGPVMHGAVPGAVGKTLGLL